MFTIWTLVAFILGVLLSGTAMSWFGGLKSKVAG